MFVLDTNVVSELMLDRPNSAVLHWLDDRLARDLFVTAVTQAEVLTGIALSARGETAAGPCPPRPIALFAGCSRTACCLFDSSAARKYARIAAVRRAAGRPISQADCQIAAIAASRGGQVVTRNVRDFEGIEVAVINPWEGA